MCSESSRSNCTHWDRGCQEQKSEHPEKFQNRMLKRGCHERLISLTAFPIVHTEPVAVKDQKCAQAKNNPGRATKGDTDEEKRQSSPVASIIK